MPCRCDGMEPSYREVESTRIINFLHELGLRKKKAGAYGDPRNLDSDTADLCAALKSGKHNVQGLSLELQIWWRDHQIADRKREEAEAQERKQRQLTEAAKRKLTPAEFEALTKKYRT
jgi:hypothetical protein